LLIWASVLAFAALVSLAAVAQVRNGAPLPGSLRPGQPRPSGLPAAAPSLGRRVPFLGGPLPRELMTRSLQG
jgi:hypothetical protein